MTLTREQYHVVETHCFEDKASIQALDLALFLVMWPWTVLQPPLAFISFVCQWWQLFLLTISKQSTGSVPYLSLCTQVLAHCQATSTS